MPDSPEARPEKNAETAAETASQDAQAAQSPQSSCSWHRWAATLSLLALFAGVLLTLAQWHFCAHSWVSKETVVQIPRGVGARQVGRILADQGLLPSDFRCLLYLQYSGLRDQLKAGEFRFTPGQTPPEILRQIAKGEVLRHPVTVVEGLRLEQIAELFAKDGWMDREKFLRLARDPALIASLRLNLPPGQSLEGYLFPDTYFMEQGMGEEQLIRHMVARFQDVWEELRKDFDEKQGKSALSRHEILTLASIVEKESGQRSERPLIARVFLNRLALGMPLQSDPTVIYGLGPEWKGRLRKANLRTATPHNTYVIPGLPPGPICAPGRAAIAATLSPADSDALYFVSRNDGTHVFSKTLAEHNKAVRQYQQGGQSSAPESGKTGGSPAATSNVSENKQGRGNK